MTFSISITEKLFFTHPFKSYLALTALQHAGNATIVLYNVFSEVLLCLLTLGGPLLILVLTLFCNAYLLFKPVLVSNLLWKSYKDEFRKARKEVSKGIRFHARNYHAYEIDGFEKIPDVGGAVIVYYHSPIPLDYMFLVAECYLKKKRVIRSIVDRYMIWMPGFEMLSSGLGAFAGTRRKCVQLLKEGRIIGVAPGGGLEAQAGSSNYELLWKKRAGFAKIAFEAGVPVIPVFVENSRENVVNLQTGLGFWKVLYDYTRIPFSPLYGGFPVKMTCRIGDPIMPESFENFLEMREAVVEEMEQLINTYQKHKPGNIWRAMAERLDSHPDYESIDREVCKCPKCLQTNSVVEDIPIQISTNPECTSTQISGNAKLNVENLIEEYCNSKEPEMGPENISSEAWSNGSDLIFNKEDGKKDSSSSGQDDEFSSDGTGTEYLELQMRRRLRRSHSSGFSSSTSLSSTSSS